MDENRSTRQTQSPDWLVQGLLRHGAFAPEQPDQPMFNTGVTYAELKGQVKATLQRSGLDLTRAELASGTYWLTERIANQVGEKDTKETMVGYVDYFVSQYLVDKMAQRITGISDRAPIFTRDWYVKHFTPTPEQKEEKGDGPGMGKDAAGDLKGVYVGLDGDDIGGMVERVLIEDDPDKAQAISESIHEAHRQIRQIVKDEHGSVIFDGGDNMLLYVAYDPDMIEDLRAVYLDVTGHSATVGVGERPIEAHFALVVGKNTGKDRTVVYSEDVKDEYESIRFRQEEIAPLYKELKYRAQSINLSSATALQSALADAGLPADDESVYEMFIRLVQRYDLGDASAISRFFSQAGPDGLVDVVREVRARRLSWRVVTGGRRMTDFEVQELLRHISDFAGAIDSVIVKFISVVEMMGPDNPALKAVDAEAAAIKDRCGAILNKIVDAVERGQLSYSSYVEEVRGVAVDVAMVCQDLDQELVTVLRAKDNAESSKDNRVVDVAPLTEKMTRLIERASVMAVVLEMMGVASAADPRVLTSANPASDPIHFPGQNLQRPRRKVSPHRQPSLTTEEQNKDAVDYSKTDWSYVSTNVPAEGQMMGGGDQGNSIYVA